MALDVYGCAAKRIRNVANSYNFLDSVPKLIETDVQSPPFIVYKKGIGFAGWIPVVDSGISLYAFFPSNFISIDVYTCKKFNTNSIKGLIKQLFEPKKIKASHFLRGQDYAPPKELLELKKKMRE